MQRTSSQSFGRAVSRPEPAYVDGPPSPEFWRFLILAFVVFAGMVISLMILGLIIAVFGMAAYETATWIWSVL